MKDKKIVFLYIVLWGLKLPVPESNNGDNCKNIIS
jgi:hypothetical protein